MTLIKLINGEEFLIEDKIKLDFEHNGGLALDPTKVYRVETRIVEIPEEEKDNTKYTHRYHFLFSKMSMIGLMIIHFNVSNISFYGPVNLNSRMVHAFVTYRDEMEEMMKEAQEAKE